MIDLQGHVVDAEALAEDALEVPAHRVAVVAGPDEHVRGERGEARGDLPHVEVVDLDDSGLGGHRATDRLGIHALGRRLEQDAPRIAQQAPAGAEHERRDEQRRDAVGAIEPGEDDHRAGGRRRERRIQVREHVLARALDVEAPPLRAPERPCGGDVDDGAHEADRDDEGAVDVGRGEQALDRRDGDDTREHEQRRAVDLRREDLGTAQAEREAPRRGLCGEAGGDEREADRRGVGEHVAGIGEQRQRRGEQAADDLDDHEARDERQRDREPPRVGVGRRSVMMMAMVVVAVVVAMAGAHGCEGSAHRRPRPRRPGPGRGDSSGSSRLSPTRPRGARTA